MQSKGNAWHTPVVVGTSSVLLLSRVGYPRRRQQRLLRLSSVRRKARSRPAPSKLLYTTRQTARRRAGAASRHRPPPLPPSSASWIALIRLCATVEKVTRCSPPQPPLAPLL